MSITLSSATFTYYMFGDDRSLLVMKVAAPELESLHREAVAMGASYDYPEFNAHLTLSDSFGGDASSLPQLPDFDLVADRYIVEPLPRLKSVPDFPGD